MFKAKPNEKYTHKFRRFWWWSYFERFLNGHIWRAISSMLFAGWNIELHDNALLFWNPKYTNVSWRCLSEWKKDRMPIFRRRKKWKLWRASLGKVSRNWQSILALISLQAFLVFRSHRLTSVRTFRFCIHIFYSLISNSPMKSLISNWTQHTQPNGIPFHVLKVKPF